MKTPRHLRIIRLSLSFLFLILLGVSVLCSAQASTYYVAANGSDSNNGASKTTPWAHLPGMATWTGSHTPAAGDTFILRGCDVWGNSNFPVTWTWSGSSGSPILIDQDTTWYNTANCPNTWNRPIFNAGSAVMGGTECSGSNQFVGFNSASHVTMKWIELTGYYWNADAGGSCGYAHTGILVQASWSDYITVDSWYIHNWSHGSSAGDSDHFWFLTGTPHCNNCLFTNGVVNNTDSAVCGSSGTRCGGGWEWSTTNSVFNWMVNELKPVSQGTFCNNNLSGVDHGFDSTHQNIIEPIDAGGGGDPNYYYFCNNYIHDNNSGELQLGNTGDVYYIWNNVNVQGANVRNWAFPQQPGANMELHFWNNTIVPAAGSPAIFTCNGCNPATWASVDIENNLVVTTSTAGNGPVPGLILCSPNDCGTSPFPTSGSRVIANNIVVTPTVATSMGYTGSSSYVYAPQNGNCNGHSTNCPIAAGADLASAWMSSFPSSDTTYACVQQTVNTVVQSVCNQRTAIARPNSAWDIGAYQLQSSTAPTFTAPASCPFTGTAPITVTLNDSNTGTHVTCYGFGTTPATNGSGTACSAGTQYSSSFTESTSGTVNAISGTSLLPDSTVASCALNVIPSQSTLISGSATISGFGTLQAQASCIAFPTLSCSPTNTNTITYPSTAPSVGGTTGAGTTFTDPAFGTTGVRITDAAFDPSMAGLANNSFTVSNASSMDDIWWSTNDMLTLVTNQGGKKYLVGFNPASMALARPYSASVSGCPSSPNNYSNCSLSGGWATGASGLAFSMVDPCTLYAYSGLTILSYVFGSDVVPWANPCSGGISGPPAATIVAANLIENLPVSCVGIACNCLPSDFGAPTWNDSGGGTTVGDALFSNAFSSVAYHFGAGTGQGSGFYAVIYSVAKGCMSYNTQTGAIQADVGWTGGSGLTCAAGQCSGTSTASATFTLHNVKMNKAGTALALASTTCITGTCTYQPFIWVPGTTTVYLSESGGPANKSSGHWALGFLGMVNDPGSPLYQLDYRLTPSSGSATTVTAVNVPPAPPCPVSTDSHEGWQMADSLDTVPFSFTRTTANLANSGLFPFDQPPCAWVGEIDMADRNGDGLVHREALAFNTNYSNFFNAANSIAECSQTGNFCSVGSDWFNIRNASGSSTSCIPSGPAWKASKVYATGYIVNPTSNNAANNSFKATSGGTAGGSTPNWTASCNSPGNTCADGSVTWTNLGVSSGVNQCGADAFAWRLR